MIFAVLPAIQASGVPARAALQESGTRSTLSRGRLFTLRGLVVGEVALALALLVGAGLVLEGFRKVMQVDPGFRPEGVLTFNVAAPAGRTPDSLRFTQFYGPVLDRLRALPGVRAAVMRRNGGSRLITTEPKRE